VRNALQDDRAISGMATSLNGAHRSTYSMPLDRKEYIMGDDNKHVLYRDHIDLLHAIFNEALHAFYDDKLSSIILNNIDECKETWNRLKEYDSHNFISFDSLSKNQWMLCIEIIQTVILDFFEYNEYGTRLGSSFQNCLDLLKRISTMAIFQQ
jgi:hypothetical protein